MYKREATRQCLYVCKGETIKRKKRKNRIESSDLSLHPGPSHNASLSECIVMWH